MHIRSYTHHLSRSQSTRLFLCASILYILPFCFIYFYIHPSSASNYIDNDITRTCDITQYPDFNNAQVCRFITSNCDSSIFKLSRIYYCSYGTNHSLLIRIGLILLIIASLLLMFTIFGLITSNFLYPNLDTLSYHLRLSRRISGLTLLALGNATPDIFSTYNAMSSNSSSLAIGELIGSANFVICFIVGAMGVLRPFKVDFREFVKDLGFFIVLISLSFYFIYDESLKNLECVVMILAYVVYLAYSITFTNEGKKSHIDVEDEENRLLIDPSLTPSFNSPERPGSMLSSRSLIDDDNKLNGLQRLSLFDSLRLFRSLSSEEFSTLGDSSPPPPSTSTVIDPSPSTVLHQPSPIHPQQSIPQIVIIDEESSLIPSDQTDLIDWSFLLYPLTKEDLKQPIQLLTVPLLVTFNFLNPLYPIHLITESTSPSSMAELDQFRIKIFKYQMFILPFIFHITLFPQFHYTYLIPIVIFFTLTISHASIIPYYKYLIPLAGFITSMLTIITTSSHLITILKNIGVIFHISESLLGLTILSVGNSTGDLISNLTLAGLDLSAIGFNACFGSPLLYILFGIGMNGLLINLQNKRNEMSLQIDYNFKVGAIGLLLTLGFYMISVPLNGWYIDRKIGLMGICWWAFITGVNVYLEIYQV